MTRKKTLEAITERMSKPENHEKYQALNKESRLFWHYKRAKDSLQALLLNSSNAQISLLESDFDVSIKEIELILESEGWA